MSSINCIEFSHLLAQTVESRLSVDTPALRGHAALCADCRAAWLDALLVDGAVTQWRTTGKRMLPSVDLTDVVLFRRTAAEEAAISVGHSPFATPGVSNDQDAPSEARDRLAAVHAPAAVAHASQPRRWRSRRTLASASAATVLATAVCVAFLSGPLSVGPRDLGVRNGDLDQGSLKTANRSLPLAPPRVAATIQASPQIVSAVPIRSQRATIAPAKVVAEAPVETMVQDAESAYLNLASEAAQAVAAATVFVPRPSPSGATTAAVDENARWVDDVGREFEPVSKNLSQAFQFLFDAVPADKAPAT